MQTWILMFGSVSSFSTVGMGPVWFRANVVGLSASSASQCVAPEDNDALDQRPETWNVINVDDDEQDEEEDERDEGGEGEEGQEEEEGEGERHFCLGQEHDSRAVREREGSEWPPDF